MTINTSDDGHAVRTEQLSSGSVLQITAKNVRLERTGLHAHLAIFLNNKILDHAEFNVLREDRNRMARSAHKMFGELDKQAYPLETFIHSLNTYTLQLESWLKQQYKASFRNGNLSQGVAQFVLKPYILEAGGTILFGPPGKGKSWVALLMAISIDAGIDTIWDITPGRTLFVNLERPPHSLDKRLAEANLALGLDADRALLFLHARGKGLAHIQDGIKQSIEEHEVTCVFVDSISRAGMGSLIEDRTANSIVDALNGLGVSWFALGHTPRQDATHLYGNTMFEAGQDIGIRLSSQPRGQQELGIGLDVVKANDIPPQQEQFYRLGFDDSGLAAFDKATKRDFPELFIDKEESLEQQMISYHQEVATTSTTTETAESLSKARSNINRVYRNSNRFVALPKEGREVRYGLKTERPDEDAPPPF